MTITPLELLERSAQEKAKLTPEESLAVRQMAFHLSAATAQMQLMDMELTRFLTKLATDRGLDVEPDEKGNVKWKIAATLDKFVPAEAPKIQIAEPGQVNAVAQQAAAASGLRVVEK